MESYFILLLFGCFVTQIHGFGHTSPDGTIRKAVGSTIEIYCVLNGTAADGYNSSNLTFTASSRLLYDDQVHIINSTAILLRIENAQPMDETFTCKLGNSKGVGVTHVVVGYKPLDVENFKCRSYNWENLKCSFEMPNNPVLAVYQLSYMPKLQSHTGSGGKCDLEADWNRTYHCTINFSSIAPYRQTHELYQFILEASNELGNSTQNFTINNYNSVIPNPPENLTSTNVTSRSAVLKWNLPEMLTFFPRKFMYDIQYTSEINKNVWTRVGPFVGNTTVVHDRKQMSHKLSLEYAHVWYDVRVYIKVNEAPDLPEMWSNYSYHNFQTASRIPDDPPRTDIGGFSFNYFGRLFIFWKQLARAYHNGNNMQYYVSEPSYRWSNTTADTMIKFGQEDFANNDLEFTIYSENSEGRSSMYSSVRVPRASKRCQPPTNIKKIKTNQVYNLSWKPPTSGPEITSYTVFWCPSKTESPNQCEGSIDFARVDSNTFEYTVNSSEMLNFAVSANSRDSSSGMTWAMCTASPNNELGQLTTIYPVNTHATYIEFKWSLKCIDQTLIKGYILEYCPIKHPLKAECKEEELRQINITADATGFNLTNLTPYTTYRTVIKMFSSDAVGPDSSPLVNTTMEAPPTAPQFLRYSAVTNTTVTLTWEVPEHINGVLRQYTVYYNGKSRNVDKQPGSTIEFVLDKLESFTEYQVVVVACTNGCSPASNSISFQTGVGVPGDMLQPKMEEKGGKQVIYWSPPSVPAGKLQYYELRVEMGRRDEIPPRVVKIRGNQCTLNIDLCRTDVYKYSFYIRAINVVHSPHANNTIIHNYEHENQRLVKRDLAQKYLALEGDDLNANSEKASTLLKRHSNAEITSSSHHPSINNHLTNANEISSTTTRRSQSPSYYDGLCEEQRDAVLQRYLDADKFPTILSGNWSNSLQYVCGYGHTAGGFYFMLVFLIIFTMAFVYATFFAMKKLKKMKDIGVELPAGLEDIKQETKGKNLECGINPRDESGHDIDLLYSSEQEQSLLRSRMESASSASTENNSQCGEMQEYDQPTEDDSAQTMSDNIEIEKCSPTPLLPVQIVTPIAQKKDTIVTSMEPPITNTMIKPNGPTLSSSNYVQMPSIMRANVPIMSNGYVSHDALIGKLASSGYTPWSAVDAKTIGDSNTQNADDIKLKTPIVASTDKQGISGYVTHKQLSDFGQLMH